MSIEHAAYRTAQVFTEPYFLTPTTIAEGKAVVIGGYGDHDPGYVLVDGILRNVGAKPLYVARTLTEAVSGAARCVLPATTGELEIRGELDQLVLFNANGSAGSTDALFQAAATARKNSKKAGGHPGVGEYVVRATPVANATTIFTVTPRYPITVTGVKTWAKTPASGATCTAAVAGPAGNLLSAATIDVTGLTTVTLQAAALTATTARLDLAPGDPITITIIGGVGLTPGDLLFGLAYNLRT